MKASYCNPIFLMKTTKSPSLVPLVPLVPAKNTSGRLQHVPQSFRQNRAFVAGQPVGSKMRPIVVLVVLVEAALPRVWDPKFDRLHAICLHISQVPKRMFRIGTSAFNSHESHADPTTARRSVNHLQDSESIPKGLGHVPSGLREIALDQLRTVCWVFRLF